MLKMVFAGAAVLVVGFALLVACQPAEYRVARSTTVAAPPAVVFAQVNDLHAFQAWSPFAKRDPAAKTRFEGPPSGTGSALAWAGSREIGAGRMTIVESRPSERVRMRLDFEEPFRSTGTAEFTFVPDGSRTAVTWSMVGANDFLAKAIHMVLNVDAMIGGDFEKGLADLKAIAESRAASS